MTNVRQHSRRTEGARRLFHPRSSAGFSTYWGSASRLRADPGQIDRSSLDERTKHLVTQLIEAAKLGSVREDATFGNYAPLFGFLRSCVMQEGRLLELGDCRRGRGLSKLEPTSATSPADRSGGCGNAEENSRARDQGHQISLTGARQRGL